MMCSAAEMPKRLRCDPAECMECLADVGDTGFGECGQAGRWKGAAQVRTLISIESGVGADDACALDLKQAGPQASKQGSKPKPSIIKSTIDICSRHTFEAPVQCTSGFAPLTARASSRCVNTGGLLSSTVLAATPFTAWRAWVCRASSSLPHLPSSRNAVHNWTRKYKRSMIPVLSTSSARCFTSQGPPAVPTHGVAFAWFGHATSMPPSRNTCAKSGKTGPRFARRKPHAA